MQDLLKRNISSSSVRHFPRKKKKYNTLDILHPLLSRGHFFVVFGGNLRHFLLTTHHCEIPRTRTPEMGKFASTWFASFNREIGLLSGNHKGTKIKIFFWPHPLQESAT